MIQLFIFVTMQRIWVRLRNFYLYFYTSNQLLLVITGVEIMDEIMYSIQNDAKIANDIHLKTL